MFYQKEAVHILMDHMCYDLQKLISSSFEKLTLNHIKTISFQMLKGLDYLHKNQVIHRVFLLKIRIVKIFAGCKIF